MCLVLVWDGCARVCAGRMRRVSFTSMTSSSRELVGVRRRLEGVKVEADGMF